jgi:putative MFS transporter
MSQLWRTRHRVIATFMIAGMATSLSYLMIGPEMKMSVAAFYLTYLMLGLAGGGCLILAFTIAAEHFGTHIRATTAIVVPNIACGLSIVFMTLFHGLGHIMSIADAAAFMALMIYVAAFTALSKLRETHGIDMDYVERLD